MSHPDDAVDLERLLHTIRARVRESANPPPLYAYRVDDHELDAIARALDGRVGRSAGLGRIEEAAFCLYGAGVFCRDHVEGSWAWRTITDRLGVEADARWLYPTVERGLGWWGREVLRLGPARQFLVSLACEGGLPIGLVRHRHTALGAYAARVLRDREAFADDRTPTLELARFRARALPRSLRRDVVYTLAAELIDGLTALRRRLPDGIERPRVWLAANIPDWADRLPLRVDGEGAQALLDLLLGQPRGGAGPGAHLSVSAALVRTTRGLRLRRGLELPRTLKNDELGGALKALELDFDPGALGPFLRFVLVDVHGAERTVGEARRSFDGQSWRFESHDRAFDDALEPLELRVQVGPRIVARGTPLGGGAMPDEPWVFADRDDGALLGSGSVRTRAPWVRVALPMPSDGSGADGIDGSDGIDGLDGIDAADATVEDIGEVAGRRLVRVSGRCSIDADGARFVVRTGAEDERREVFDLRGRSLPLAPGGGPVWCGWPRVLHRLDDEPGREVPPTALEVRVAGDRWAPLRGAPVGVVSLRWVDDGEVRFMRRLTVMPPGFRCEVVPGPGRAQGRLRLLGVPGAEAGVTPCDAFEWQSAPSQDGIDLVFTQRGEPAPDAVDVRLRLGPPRPVEVPLRLPFPVPFTGFVGLDGAPLPRGAIRRLDQLSTLRARVRAVRPGEEHAVWGRIERYPWSYLMPLRAESAQAFELGLDAVRDVVEVLQARSADLDCAVELTVRASGGALKGDEPRLKVQRYAQRLVPLSDPLTPGRRRLVREQAEGDGLVPPARVDVRPLWAPGEPPRDLPADGEGGWLLDDGDFAPGPWLAVGWRGDLAVTRPLLVTVGGPATAPPDVSASVEALIRAPQEVRDAAMYGLHVELANDPASPKWDALRPMLAEVGTLPASTFDVVRRLVDAPRVMALAAIKMGDHDAFADFWDGMERLPWVWWLVPIDGWLAAARCEQARLDGIAETLAARLGREAVRAMADRPLAQFGERLAARTRSMTVMLEVLHTARLPVPAPASPLMQLAALGNDAPLRAVREGAMQDLLRSHAAHDGAGARDWPPLESRTLDEMLRALRGPRELFDALRLDPLGRPERQPVLDAPVIAALAVAFGHRLRHAHVFALRTLRGFDDQWFDDAYVFTLALALAERARLDPEFLS